MTQVVPSKRFDTHLLQRNAPGARIRRIDRPTQVGEDARRVLTDFAPQHEYRVVVQRHPDRLLRFRLVRMDPRYPASQRERIC